MRWSGGAGDGGCLGDDSSVPVVGRGKFDRETLELKDGHKVGFARRVATLLAAACGTYLMLIRPWHLRWGATDEEVSQSMPGDEIIEHAELNVTRAITIEAPPEAVWPWLVQIGHRRGGFYSYDSLENLLGLEIHSADRIIPELQRLEAGDTIPLGPETQMTVVAMEPPGLLALHTVMHPLTGRAIGPDERAPRTYLDWSWTWTVEEFSEKTTRLTLRTRARYKPRLLVGLGMSLLIEPIHFVMERKMLLGIKERAERGRAR